MAQRLREKRSGGVSEAVPYAQLPPASRVRAVESVRQRLFELAEKLAEKFGEGRPPEDLPLSAPAQIWLERLSCALADPTAPRRPSARWTLR
jgi:hypothetical protein